MSKISFEGVAMRESHTPHIQQKAQPGPKYTLPEADRKAILAGTDSARLRAVIHKQRERFLALNNGFEFGEQSEQKN
jgi:hypothetical protein